MAARPSGPGGTRERLPAPAQPAVSLRAGALVLTLMLALAGCGGGGSGSGAADAAPNPAITPADESRFLVAYMTDWYLWYRQLPPSIDAASFASADAALAALRVSQDRYSFIDSAATFDAFFDEGRSLGFGFAYALVGSDMWIRYVQPQSNAWAAGLRRGDRITAIGGTPVATLVQQGRLDAAIGPVTEGYSASFETLRTDGSTGRFTMAKSWYAIANVIDARVIDQPGGRRVGYINFLSFTETASTEWNRALAQVLDAGATDLVVDLRDNGGGRLSVANAVASSLAPASAIGNIGTTLQFNDRHTGSNQSFVLTATTGTGQVGRLVWITSARTCSASESLMTSLRPYRSASVVGQTSCGKPVGFTPPTYNGRVFNIVTFRNLNRDGFSDYYSGLSPDCPSSEDYARPFGDPTEPMLAAALQSLAGSGCPTAAAKSTASATAAQSAPGDLRNLTGLY